MQWILLAVGASSLVGTVVGVGRGLFLWAAGAFFAEALMPVALGAN